MSRVTLKTIAERIGVSRTTVSNAFSKPDQLAPELRQQILRTAHELGYAGPDPVARTLRRGRADTIGMLFTESLSYAFADPYAVALMHGVAGVAEDAGVALLLIPSTPESARRPAGAMDVIVDGFLVFCMADDDELAEGALRRGVPVVFIDQRYEPGRPVVRIDDVSAARTMAEHVFGLGHVHVAVVADRLHADGRVGRASLQRQREATFAVSRARLDGFAMAAAAAGIDWSQVEVCEVGANTIAGGVRAGASLLDRPQRPTAILCSTDAQAIGVLRVAADRGIPVPEELSVTGFDDVPEAASTTPPLTTIRQPAEDKGRTAASLLLHPEAHATTDIVMPTELIVRASTGPAPAR